MTKLAVALVVALVARAALADGPNPYGPFLVSYDVGALVAAGGERNLLDDAVLVGLTGSYEVIPFLAVVGSVSRAQTDAPREGERSLLQYDVGLRGQLPFGAAEGVTVVPFLGGGVGARTTDDREVGGTVNTDLTAYVGVGARVEYLFGNASVTVRDYVSGGHGPSLSNGRGTRHDLALCASVGVRF